MSMSGYQHVRGLARQALPPWLRTMIRPENLTYSIFRKFPCHIILTSIIIRPTIAQ
jgi:hypothetical protein